MHKMQKRILSGWVGGWCLLCSIWVIVRAGLRDWTITKMSSAGYGSQQTPETEGCSSTHTHTHRQTHSHSAMWTCLFAMVSWVFEPKIKWCLWLYDAAIGSPKREQSSKTFDTFAKFTTRTPLCFPCTIAVESFYVLYWNNANASWTKSLPTR